MIENPELRNAWRSVRRSGLAARGLGFCRSKDRPRRRREHARAHEKGRNKTCNTGGSQDQGNDDELVVPA
jgi:hypothetical protein